ncbi:hypothetical protein AAG747_04290 [Rapidithrix thailandica]|uniref:Fibronectin type-III domain-containing protein n=1 Tax=Rapidithrix thailandica TaxID=413964 RepID=A0AAW9RU04_9BACT
MFFVKRQIFLLLFIITSVQLNLYAQTPSSLEVPDFGVDDGSVYNSGALRLTWVYAKDLVKQDVVEFEVQQASSSEFVQQKAIYRGPDLATFISGLKNGTYFYRIRALRKDLEKKSPWSSPLRIEVKHHPLSLAFTLAGVGTFVFLATAVVVFQGSRNQK